MGIAGSLLIPRVRNILLHIGDQKRRDLLEHRERSIGLLIQWQRNINRDLHTRLRSFVLRVISALRASFSTSTTPFSIVRTALARKKALTRLGGRFLGGKRGPCGEMEVENAGKLKETMSQKCVSRKEVAQLIKINKKI